AIVFWSWTSIKSPNVSHEAAMASDRGKLVPVLLNPLSVHQFPLGLYSQQAANLSEWNASLEHDEWCKLRKECETKMMPPWARRQIYEIEAELVGERARRENAEHRDKILEAQIAKEAQIQQNLKRERDKALDEIAVANATIEELTRARSDAERRQAEVRLALESERDEALARAVVLQARVEELSRVRLDD